MPFAPPASDSLLFVTGATGLVGSHVVERFVQQGWRVRALCRPSSNVRLLQKLGVELVTGSMTEPYALQGGVRDATHIVHAAAMLGDWGRVEPYRDVNVTGFESLLDSAVRTGKLQRLVYISTQGVYPVGDHFATTESTSMHDGVDGYTITKVEAEKLLQHYARREQLPAVILRPGWIYGPRDRTVIPNVLQNIRSGRFTYLGSGEQKISNTYVQHLVDAVELALVKPGIIGEAFNITDGRLVTKHEFFGTIAELAGLPRPTRHMPLWLGKGLARGLEGLWKLTNQTEPPPLSTAKIKILGLNLDFSIAKARERLGYNPHVDFRAAMQTTMDWFGRHAEHGE
jgi:nucleoside-diphosphate-sugar epimerase